ncbi:hypothetical protein KUCAC02_007060 [Chaenocephalus aceratus]|nr:hypothetical protein KUCAC02_007060 [Chaenocephalus aceratus]
MLTRRWPVAVFYNVLDLAAIDAWVLRSCMSREDTPRRDFTLQLAHGLRAEWMASKGGPALQRCRRAQENDLHGEGALHAE